MVALRGVILVNPYSGPDSTDAEAIEAAVPGHRVETCEPDELGERARAAVAAGAGFVGVAGSDGTIRSVADEIRDTDVALLAIPAGTRNHFARELGLGDLDAVADAVAGGRRRRIDLGEVNGECFVNNASIGLYPRIVIRREAYERRLRKPVANVIAVYEQLRHGRRFRVEVDGDEVWAWMIFVGNGRYGEGLLDLTDREGLDEHVLDVRVVRADRPVARLRVVLALLLGRLARSPLVERRTTTSVRLELPRPSIEVALDGEVEFLDCPLEFTSQRQALAVISPPD